MCVRLLWTIGRVAVFGLLPKPLSAVRFTKSEKCEETNGDGQLLVDDRYVEYKVSISNYISMYTCTGYGVHNTPSLKNRGI